MDAAQLDEGRAAAAEVRSWYANAHRFTTQRSALQARESRARTELQRCIHPVGRGATAWLVLPLERGDGERLAALAAWKNRSPVNEQERMLLSWLTDTVPAAVQASKAASGIRRIFSGRNTRDQAETALVSLVEFRNSAGGARTQALLQRLAEPPETIDTHPSLALSPRIGLADAFGWSAGDVELHNRADYDDLAGPLRRLEAAIRKEGALRGEASEAGRAVRHAETKRLLSEMPVERLRDATAGRLNLGALTRSGLTSVQQVLDAGHGVQRLDGIGPTTATRMVGAAQTLWHTTYDEMPFRIDIKRRGHETTAYLRALIAWNTIRRMRAVGDDGGAADAFDLLSHVFGGKASHFVVVSQGRNASGFPGAVEALRRQAQSFGGRPLAGVSGDPWQEFMSRPADYLALSAELGFVVEDEEKSHADLPAEIIDSARRIELDTQFLTANLRGYQQFAARYTLAQKKVIIGDEMGLGKTIEAIAVLAHMRAKGHHHSIVVCPAAVVTNWVREVADKSTLPAHRLHGTDRARALRSWRYKGGVAVTTFETLGWLEGELPSDLELGVVVVDEAHYIKNPQAKRSRRTHALLNRVDRAVLMTGTPMENRLEEFQTLVRYVRPHLQTEVAGLSPQRFRRKVAPVYLRRNQEDVLQELPELVEVDEWLPLSGHDMGHYRQAVYDGNFMALRQAAILAGPRSSKVQRLLEIVEEAEENGRKVIVFSHFLAVLDEVARVLPGRVFGPLTGRVSPAMRQDMVDRFSGAGHGAVLVSQIVAGGVGLNIQAASVVIICEPQLKPTTEWQAIARARRMGQLNSVQVHRLLSEEGVDQRVVQLLAHKKRLFDEFARASDIADRAPEALDISEADLAREVLAVERQRLMGQPPA